MVSKSDLINDDMKIYGNPIHVTGIDFTDVYGNIIAKYRRLDPDGDLTDVDTWEVTIIHGYTIDVLW